MTQETKHIEDIFKQAFEHHEVQPPHTMWEAVEASLDNSKNVETLFATTFKNARISPAAGVWKRISQALFWRSFFTFSSNSFNIYYLGAALSICGVTLYSVFPPQARSEKTLVNPVAELVAIVSEIKEEQAKVEYFETNVETKVEAEIASVKNPEAQVANVRRHEKTISEAAKTVTSIQAIAETEKAVSSTFNFANVQIVGNTNVCANSATEYYLEGVPANAVIDWNMPQNASFKAIAPRKIAALFGKEGSFTLSANVKVDAVTKKIELPVRVEEALTPEIKGRRSVCEGSEKELYSVDEAINKEITYAWATGRNTLHNTGNKYINIDWKTVGMDTLTVTRINLATGCSSSNSTVIAVQPQPKVDFAMTAISTNEYEFWFVGESKKIQSFRWSVDGSQHSGETFVHTNYGAQTSLVKLEIADKAGCKNSIQKEITFGRNVLFVPKTFDLASGNGFIPQTNTRLRSYTIEIYNSQSEKIWSSSELIDGKPAKAWNGIYKNAPVGKGKYMWRISATFDDGTQWHGVRQKDGKVLPTGIFVVEK